MIYSHRVYNTDLLEYLHCCKKNLNRKIEIFNNLFIFVSGAKSQVLQTVVRLDLSMELFALAVGAHGISSGEYAATFCRLSNVLQVSI